MPRRRVITLALLAVALVVTVPLASYAMWRRATTRQADGIFEFLEALPEAERVIFRGTFCDDVAGHFVPTDRGEIDELAALYAAARPSVDYGTSWSLKREAALATNIAGTIAIESAGESHTVRYLSPSVLVIGETTAVRLDDFDLHAVHVRLLAADDATE